MNITGMQIRSGMRVVGSDGHEVGTVKEVRTNDFLLNRQMARDIYVPFSAVQNVTADTISLNIPSGQVDNMGWANPPLMGSAGR